jgi:hypothetical protein
MFSAFESAWDIETFEDNKNYLAEMGKGIVPPPGSQSEKPYSPFMDVYAALGRGGLMERFGITQRQLAAVSSKNHGHSVHNERSQYRNAISIEDVLAAPPITYPITLPMCSPISDGAAAAIVCTESALKKYGFDRKRAVKVLASVVRSASARAADDFDKGCTHLAGKAAFEQAGISPKDVDVAEIHDATAIGELLAMESLGLCEAGASGEMAERGETTLGGKLPINPSGGLESKGHPIGATGIGQIFELVEQLRGDCGKRQVEGARIALQGNGGGLWRVEESTEHVGIFGLACGQPHAQRLWGNVSETGDAALRHPPLCLRTGWLHFVEAPALTPAPLPQAGEGRKQAVRQIRRVTGDSAVRAKRCTLCQGTQPAMLSARSAAEGVPPITWLAGCQ